MKSVYLDHELKLSRNNLAAISLLLIGGALSAAVFVYAQQLTNQTEALQIDMQKYHQLKATARAISTSSHTSLSGNNKEYAGKRDEVAIVNSAIKDIMTPWSALFKALESANQDEVKLLALEPSAQSPSTQQRTVRITAVALDSNSMMRYVDELTQLKVLMDVTLLSQESTEMNGQKAIQFVIEAVWKI